MHVQTAKGTGGSDGMRGSFTVRETRESADFKPACSTTAVQCTRVRVYMYFAARPAAYAFYTSTVYVHRRCCVLGRFRRSGRPRNKTRTPYGPGPRGRISRVVHARRWKRVKRRSFSSFAFPRTKYAHGGRMCTPRYVHPFVRVLKNAPRLRVRRNRRRSAAVAAQLCVKCYPRCSRRKYY